MINEQKIIVVLPAYNAEKTLERTYNEIPKEIIDEIILVDDHSSDKTIEVAKLLGITIIQHRKNLGYGGNQKTCYTEALKRGADIVVMLHPDYQYPPKLVPAMAVMISSGMFDVVLGSRILGGYALRGGMPLYKYIFNRFLTLYQNILTGQKLSEYHTGIRAFSRKVLEKLPLLENSDDFVFDNQILAQTIFFKFRIGEVTAKCKYNKECSSINLQRSIIYGLSIIWGNILYVLAKWGWAKPRFLDEKKR